MNEIDDILRAARERAAMIGTPPPPRDLQRGPAYWRGNCVLVRGPDDAQSSCWLIQVGRRDGDDFATRRSVHESELRSITWDRARIVHCEFMANERDDDSV